MRNLNCLENLVIIFSVGIGTLGGLSAGLLTGGILYNLQTYNSTKNEISKAKTAEDAIFYCKMVLKDSYESSRISKLVGGGDDAAKEYLEKIELNK